jgi:RNA polymerase sigma factor (sigma-70 family)
MPMESNYGEVNRDRPESADSDAELNWVRGRLPGMIRKRTAAALVRDFNIEDLAMQVLGRAALAVAGGKTIGNRRAYLSVIADRLILDEIRRTKRLPTPICDRLDDDATLMGTRGAAEPVTTPSRAAIRREETELVKQLLLSLPIAQSQALKLRYFEGLSVLEIAKLMGRTRQAVEGLLRRGLKHLRLDMSA